MLVFTAIAAFTTWLSVLVNSNPDIWRAIVRHQTMRGAQTALDEERYRDAIERYDRVEAMDGAANYRVQLGRGYSKWQIGDFTGASEDLWEAYRLSNDLAIRDAAAYTAYQSGNLAKARTLYSCGSQYSANEPALRHLSASMIALELRQPQFAGMSSRRARATGVHPQIAHHLSGIRTVELHEQRNINVSRSIPSAVENIEQALSLGPIYPRLRLDAVRVFALAIHYDRENPELLGPLRRHTELAVAEGISLTDLTRTPGLRDLTKTAPWYADMIASADRSTEIVDTVSFPIDLLARPTAEQILR